MVYRSEKDPSQDKNNNNNGYPSYRPFVLPLSYAHNSIDFPIKIVAKNWNSKQGLYEKIGSLYTTLRELEFQTPYEVFQFILSIPNPIGFNTDSIYIPSFQ